MKKAIQFLGAGIILVSLFSSCTVEKRKYVSGYNIQLKNSKPDSEKNKTVQNSKPAAGAQIVSAEKPAAEKIIDDEKVAASSGNATIIRNNLAEKTISHPDVSPEECDVITLKNGDEVKGKVTEITQDEIKYKKCGDLNGPTYTLKKSEVFMIKYPNGTKDVIAQDSSDEKKNEPTEKEDSGIFGVLSFATLMGSILLSIIGAGAATILLLPAAIVLAILGLGKGRKHKGFAIATLVIIGLSLILLLILLALYSGGGH